MKGLLVWNWLLSYDPLKISAIWAIFLKHTIFISIFLRYCWTITEAVQISYLNLYFSNFHVTKMFWKICLKETQYVYLACIYLSNVSNGNPKTRCEICWMLTIKIPERPQWCRSGVFIVNFEHTLHLVLVFLSLTLNMYFPAG